MPKVMCSVPRLFYDEIIVDDPAYRRFEKQGHDTAEIRLPYKPKIITFLLAVLFFAVIGFFLAHKALTNDRGLILSRIFEFSSGEASVFYMALAVISGIFVVVGIIAIITGLTAAREVVATDRSISAPKGSFSRKTVNLDYSEIMDLNIQTVRGHSFLNIIYPGGKLTIPHSMLPDKASFHEMANFVAARVGR